MTPRRDASMTLLAEVTATALDPAYRARPRQRRSPGWQGTALLVAIGLLLGLAAAQTSQGRGERADERRALLAQVSRSEERHDALEKRIDELSRRLDAARDEALGQGEAADATRSRLEALGVAAGTLAVHGEGLTLTLDDAPDATTARGRVLDVDLRQVVNGLWAAGAEAVAVNGQRVTPTTAIRTAGQAITVNYRSLAKPYRVQAVGDGRTLAGRFAATPGGAWLAFLRANYGVRTTLVSEREIMLPAAPEPGLRHAARKEG